MAARLITIPFSHFCEKARWALDRAGIAYDEHGHLPLFHYVATLRAGAKRTVPVLRDGTTLLEDSSDIVVWADARKPGSLLPTDPSGRAEALALEDTFDRDLGPATRRWAYYHLLPRREAREAMTSHVPRWQALALSVTRPVAIAFLKRGLNLTPQGVERSTKKIDDTFAKVSDLLRDGRDYLVGTRFSIADLTFASLAAPVLQPEGHPMQPSRLELFTADARAQIDQWRATPAGRLALRMYADHRR